MRVEGPNRNPVRRDLADGYLLTSLVAFGVTVVSVRVFLELTGFPQLGNSVLHIAHALWGALLLFIAVLLPLIFANRWAVQASALLSGMGIGLFIDEVGKFITQSNDYFFPPALPLIYGFFLMTLFVYLYFRRPAPDDARKAMYHVLEGLQDFLDDNVDRSEADRIEGELAVAERSDREAISSLAGLLNRHLEAVRPHLPEHAPGFLNRTVQRIDKFGRRLGRRNHHRVISILLILWSISAVLTSAGLAFFVLGGVDLQDKAIRATLSTSELSIVDSPLWLTILTLLEVAVAILALVATYAWLRGREARSLDLATFGLVGSLVLLQPLMFYIQQFAATGGTLIQFAFLIILQAYRRWYLDDQPQLEEA